MTEQGDMQITYDVRELLERIEDKQTIAFARLEKSLESKADKADVARIEARLDIVESRHGERIMALEQKDRDEAVRDQATERRKIGKWTLRQKVWASLGTILLILATAFGPYLASHLHF